MNKTEIQHRAHAIVYDLIQKFFDSGEPFYDVDANELPEAEATALQKALERIQLRYIAGEIKHRADKKRRAGRKNAS